MNATWKDPKYTPLANLASFVKHTIRFRDWEFHVYHEQGIPYLQVFFIAEDNWSSGEKEHAGRKWRLSYRMTRGEIVQTALKAVLTALEHEAREQFLYRERAVFGPHLDPDALWEIADQTVVRSEHAKR